jgi:hypothetical protein
MTDLVVEFGIYHDAGLLACTRGMRVPEEGELSALRPCSRCFPATAQSLPATASESRQSKRGGSA